MCSGGFCGEMSLISLGPIPVKVTIPASLEKIFEIRVGDLSEREKTVSYFGNCKNRRHETAVCVSASRVRRMDYRVRVCGCLGPPHTPRTQQSSRLNIPLPVFPAIIRCRSGLKRVLPSLYGPRLLTSFASTETPFRDQICSGHAEFTDGPPISVTAPYDVEISRTCESDNTDGTDSL